MGALLAIPIMIGAAIAEAVTAAFTWIGGLFAFSAFAWTGVTVAGVSEAAGVGGATAGVAASAAVKVAEVVGGATEVVEAAVGAGTGAGEAAAAIGEMTGTSVMIAAVDNGVLPIVATDALAGGLGDALMVVPEVAVPAIAGAETGAVGGAEAGTAIGAGAVSGSEVGLDAELALDGAVDAVVGGTTKVKAPAGKTAKEEVFYGGQTYKEVVRQKWNSKTWSKAAEEKWATELNSLLGKGGLVDVPLKATEKAHKDDETVANEAINEATIAAIKQGLPADWDKDGFRVVSVEKDEFRVVSVDKRRAWPRSISNTVSQPSYQTVSVGSIDEALASPDLFVSPTTEDQMVTDWLQIPEVIRPSWNEYTDRWRPWSAKKRAIECGKTRRDENKTHYVHFKLALQTLKKDDVYKTIAFAPWTFTQIKDTTGQLWWNNASQYTVSLSDMHQTDKGHMLFPPLDNGKLPYFPNGTLLGRDPNGLEVFGTWTTQILAEDHDAAELARVRTEMAVKKWEAETGRKHDHEEVTTRPSRIRRWSKLSKRDAELYNQEDQKIKQQLQGALIKVHSTNKVTPEQHQRLRRRLEEAGHI